MAEAAPDKSTTTDQWPVLPRDTDIAVKCAPLQKVVDRANELMLTLYPLNAFGEGGKLIEGTVLVISDDETAAKAADLVQHCTKALTTIDNRRKDYSEPARTFTTNLNNEVKLYTVPVEGVKAAVAAALLKHQQKKRDDAAEAGRKAKAQREADALEAAKTLEAQGNTVAAARVIEVAASAPRRSAVRPTETRGASTGRKVGMRTTWNGAVNDPKVIMQACIDGKLSMDGVTFAPAWLNRIAAAHMKEEVFCGVKVTKTESLA